jgi:hypothetical protein
MSSTAQLIVGLKASYKDIYGGWLKQNNNCGYCVHMSQNTKCPKARFFSVCYTAPVKLKHWKELKGCKAHIKAVGDSRKSMEVISVNLTHTCTRSSHNKRKRNYLTRHIQNVSDVVSVYQPARGGSVGRSCAIPSIPVVPGRWGLVPRPPVMKNIDESVVSL